MVRVGTVLALMLALGGCDGFDGFAFDDPGHPPEASADVMPGFGGVVVPPGEPLPLEVEQAPPARMITGWQPSTVAAGGASVPTAGGWVSASAGAGAPTRNHDFVELPSDKPRTPRVMEDALWTPGASGSAIAVHGDEVFAVDTDNGRLVVLNRTSGAVSRSIVVGARPELVLVESDGTAYVTVRHGARVARILPGASVVDAELRTGVEPQGIAFGVDDRFLVLTITGEHSLVVVDLSSGQEISRYRELLVRPSRVAVNSAGVATVAHAGGDIVQVDMARRCGEVIPSSARTMDLRTELPWDVLHPDRGSFVRANRAAAVTIDPVTDQALVVHRQVLSDAIQDPFMAALNLMAETDPEAFPPFPQGEGMEGGGGYGDANLFPSEEPRVLRPVEIAITSTGDDAPHLAGTMPVLDAATGEPMTALFDQPTDIAHHPTHSLAMVTAAGTDNVLVMETAGGDIMGSPVALIEVGAAPRGIAFSADGEMAYVLNAHDFSVSEIDLSPLLAVSDGQALATPMRLRHERVASIGSDPLPEDARLGRRAFTFARDARISHGGTFACATCHTEGTDDQQLWFVGDGPRQTPSLAGRLDGTAPFNWRGSEGELDDNMSQTIVRMGGEGLDAEVLASLERFMLVGLVAPPNPYRDPAGPTEAQARGKEIFQRADVGCVTCHAGEVLTDGRLWDVGTTSDIEREIQNIVRDFSGVDMEIPLTLNTPSLRGLFYTAPYLHDGSAPTLRDVLTKTATTMGRTEHLTAAEKDDLIAYLLTL